MIRISVEVTKGNESFVVAAQAKSIGRALNAVKAVYGTDDAKVLFPVEPESFFVEDGVEAVRRERTGAGA
jgi:hypothetical protein